MKLLITVTADILESGRLTNVNLECNRDVSTDSVAALLRRMSDDLYNEDWKHIWRASDEEASH